MHQKSNQRYSASIRTDIRQFVKFFQADMFPTLVGSQAVFEVYHRFYSVIVARKMELLADFYISPVIFISSIHFDALKMFVVTVVTR